MAWLAVGVVCILLVIVAFYPRINSPMALLSNLKYGPTLIRKKIPEEVKSAANVHRGKIPAGIQPAKQAIKSEDPIKVAKQPMLSQPMVERPEQKEPEQESDLRPQIESPPNNVTMPPVSETLAPQPTNAVTEYEEPTQQTGLASPIDSKTNEETKPAQTKLAPSQPVIAPPQKMEPQLETELLPPMQSPTVDETRASMAKTLPSRSPIPSPNQSESRPEAQPGRPLKSRVKIETMLPAEESSVSSRATGPHIEQEERLEAIDPRHTEVDPQPVKEEFKEKTEEWIIHREKWLLSQNSSHYTIQLMGVRKEELLFDFIQSDPWLQQNEIAFYQTTFKDKPWFQLLYGVYPTKKEAQSTADTFPPKIRKSSPWIRRLSGVQKAIRKHAAQ
jgi:septal ring-binding cell division protein DamX